MAQVPNADFYGLLKSQLFLLRVEGRVMDKPGTEVYFVVRRANGEKARLTGRVVEASEDSVIVASKASSLPNTVPQIVLSTGGDNPEKLAFLRLEPQSLTSTCRVGWEKGKVPALKVCLETWKKVGAAELVSSDLEKPQDVPRDLPQDVPRKKTSKVGLQEDFSRLRKVLAAQESDESGESSDELPEFGARLRSGHLPPGQKPRGMASSSKADRKDAVSEQDVLMSMVEKGLEQGQNPSDLLPVMMMSMLVQQQKSDKSRRKARARGKEWGSLGGSSDDSDDDDVENLKDSGMKSVVTLQKLHRRVKRHPKRVIAEFEREILEELGVVEGQAWSIRDWLRQIQWSKYKGLQRCAAMTAAAYELARAGQADAACAQLAQNLKSIHQCVLQQGSWETAWLLTGVADPCSKREFGGSKEEMAIVSQYISSLSKLRKRVKETQSSGVGDEEGEGGGKAK